LKAVARLGGAIVMAAVLLAALALLASAQAPTL
jgi:hypothetical protein